MKRIEVELKSYISSDDTKLNNEYSWLIMANGKEAGCVNLIREHFNDNFLVLDMEIKEEFKNNNIREKTINQISNFNITDLIVMKNNDKYLSLTC